jgi:hypothetical protein
MLMEFYPHLMSNPQIEVLIPQALNDLQRQAVYVWLATVCRSVIRRRPFERRNQRHADMVRERRELLELRLQIWQDELPNQPLKRELAELEAALARRDHQLWEVTVNDGRQFEVNTITMSPRPYMVDVQVFEPMRWDDEATTALELENLFGVTGLIPKTKIQISGLADRQEDHLLCAFMAADLLGYYESAYAKVWLRPFFHTPRGEAEWTVEDTRRLAASFRGLTYEIAFGRREAPKAYHLLDAESLHDWANHPKFYL